MFYSVQNKISGHIFGTFTATSEQEAVIACLVDSGTEYRGTDDGVEVYVGDEWVPCELVAELVD